MSNPPPIADPCKRITRALIVPSILFITVIVLMLIFFTVLLPQRAVLLEKTGQQIPLTTQMLIAVSMFLKAWWWAFVAGIGAMVLLCTSAVSTPKGRAWWHRILPSSRIERIATCIQPVLILIVAFIVGVILYSMFAGIHGVYIGISPE